MPGKSGKLNALERTFVVEYARTNDPTYAAMKAGYASPQPRGAQNLAKPAIQQAVVEEQRAIIENELLPLSVAAARDLLTNPATPAGARVNIIKVVFDRAFGSDDGKASKELHEMTLEELERRRQEIMSQAANEAKPILELEHTNAQSAPISSATPSVFG